MAFIYGAGTVHLNDKDRGYYYFNGTNPALSDNYTFQQDQFAGYAYLDYILVGGGGGGAGAFLYGDETFPAGGGGSGAIIASFNYSGNNNGFVYSITNTGNSTINLSGITSIQIQIGQGGSGGISGDNAYSASGTDGGSTTLTLSGPSSPISANGGGGALGSTPGNPFGNGASGFNGGGAGGTKGISGDYEGTGGIASGGGNGDDFSIVYNVPGNSFVATSGNGGGNGAGNGYSLTLPISNITLSYYCDISGAGAAGSSVTLQSGIRTGGDATGGVYTNDTGYTLPIPPTPTAGYDYTGGGGAGGCISYILETPGSGTSRDGTNGGKGYAILYFHN